MKVSKEVAFEDAIVDWLVSAGGYTRGIPTNYDPAVALDSAELFTFIGATQADEWESLVQRNGGDPDIAQRRFTERLAKQIDDRGTVDVLRHGVEDLGVHIRLAYFRPASGLNPDLEAKYDANRLTVIRQLHYAPEHANSLDLALFVVGRRGGREEQARGSIVDQDGRRVPQLRVRWHAADRCGGRRGDRGAGARFRNSP
jgi:type I restriction enzyme R subunit